ncbi:MAG: stage III sporulation protein AB [Clostridia bacterium]
MKFVLLILIVASCSFLGYSISGYYRKREKFYFDIHSFICSLQLEINFFENKLKKIVAEKGQNFGKEFSQVINYFEQFLLSSSKSLQEKDMFAGIWFLSTDEKQFIFPFFLSLGKFNSSNQVASLENFKKHFYDCSQNSKKENEKFGSLIFKLGILFGILIALILM